MEQDQEVVRIQDHLQTITVEMVGQLILEIAIIHPDQIQEVAPVLAEVEVEDHTAAAV